jgi:hypothetical protein
MYLVSIDRLTQVNDDVRHDAAQVDKSHPAIWLLSAKLCMGYHQEVPISITPF